MAIIEVHMSNKRYTEEFKIEAVRQIVDSRLTQTVVNSVNCDQSTLTFTIKCDNFLYRLKDRLPGRTG